MAKPATLDQALAFFDRAVTKLPKPPERPAPGFFTAVELAKKRGWATGTMKRKLDSMVELKLAEVREGRVKHAKVAYYRVFPIK